MVKLFEKKGGLALLLCTANPIAGSLYEKHGFWYTIGDGMQRTNSKLSTKIDNFSYINHFDSSKTFIFTIKYIFTKFLKFYNIFLQYTIFF